MVIPFLVEFSIGNRNQNETPFNIEISVDRESEKQEGIGGIVLQMCILHKSYSVLNFWYFSLISEEITLKICYIIKKNFLIG